MGDLPKRTADTMLDAIALSSPSGRMSKRARAAAEKRLHDSLFGPEGLKGPEVEQPSKADSLLAHAARLRALAAKGMSVRKFTKAAEEAEAQATALKSEGQSSR